MKSICKNIILILIFVFFIGITNVNADLTDHSGGSSGDLSSLTSSDGKWDYDETGIKVVIIRKNSEGKYYEEDAEIILHENVPKTLKFSTNNHSKLFQSTSIKWSDLKATSNYPKTDLIPESWIKSGDTINLHSILSKNNYAVLKAILELPEDKDKPKLFPTIKSGDYIIIEPMTYIDKYFGTAFELGNAFLGNSKFFNYYAGAVFGGNMLSSKKDRRCGGLLFNTIYLENNLPDLGLSVYSNPDDCKTTTSKTTKKKEIQANRNNCLTSKTCGRGIGVFEFNSIYTGSIEITKYKTGTTDPIKNVGFTLYEDSSCKKVFVNEKKTNSKGKVTFSNLKAGNYYYKETSVPANYKGNTNCNKISVTDGKKSSKTVYNTEESKTGVLSINIKNQATNTNITNPDAQINFEVYSGSNCQGIKIGDSVRTSAGTASFQNLNPGTYSILASSNPLGYDIYDPKYVYGTTCINNIYTISSGKKTTANIYYLTDCDTKLASFGANPTKEQLFSLYKEYPGNRNLLNLSNPSCTPNTCNDNKLTLGCLSGTTNPSNFNENDLSCYDGEPLTDIVSGNYIGFCQTSYVLTNNLGVNKFYNKSGRLLITQNENTITIFEKNDLDEIIEKTIANNFVATASTSKVCYTLSGINIEDINTLPQYDVYFGDNNADDNVDSLPNEEIPSPVNHNISWNGFNVYIINKINNYKLNPFYLKKITGKYSETKSNSTTETPVYGILSRFDTSSGIIPFKVNNTSSNSCTYETQPQIIQYDKSEDGKIELEYRIIDTKTPFNRKTNFNWSDGSDNSKDNKIVTEVIKDKNNSYNQMNAEPIYSIRLTPSDIKIIRSYNKANKYDNYEIYCDDDGLCHNAFLYDLSNGVLNSYANNEIIEVHGSLKNLLLITKDS